MKEHTPHRDSAGYFQIVRHHRIKDRYRQKTLLVGMPLICNNKMRGKGQVYVNAAEE